MKSRGKGSRCWKYTSCVARLVAEGVKQVEMLKPKRLLFERVDVDWNSSEYYSTREAENCL